MVAPSSTTKGKSADSGKKTSILSFRFSPNEKTPNTTPKSPISAACSQNSGSTATGNSARSPTSESLATSAYPTSTLKKTAQTSASSSTASSPGHLSNTKYWTPCAPSMKAPETCAPASKE